MTQTLRLARPPELYRFNARKDSNAELKLTDELKRRFKYTEHRLIERPEDLKMNPLARVNDRYQLTTSALSQICSRTASGLSQTIQSVAGPPGLPGERCDGFDPSLAIKIYNNVVQLKFGKLEGYSLVVDHDRKTIDGLVGKRYEYYSNHDFYGRILQFMADVKRPGKFYGAALHGRRFGVRFMGKDPVFELKAAKKGEPFMGGYHFGNSETGDCSVKAAVLVMRVLCSNMAISEFSDGGKLAHLKGPRFEGELGAMLQRVADKSEELTTYKPRIQEMMQTRLGLGDDVEEHKARVKELARQLQKQGMPLEFGRDTIKHAAENGSYPTDAIVRSKDYLRKYAERTEYDLFNAITHRAKSLGFGGREQVEQVAYRMLTGKFSLN